MLRNGYECGENLDNENLKATTPNIDYDRSKTARECGIFNYLGSMIINDASCTQKIKSWIVMAKTACNKKFLFTRKLDLHLTMKPVRCHILYGAETWTLWKVDQKYLKSIEMWC